VGCKAQTAEWVANTAVPVSIGKDSLTAMCVVQGMNVTSNTVFQWSNGTSVVPKTGKYIITVQAGANRSVSEIVTSLNISTLPVNTTMNVTNPSLLVDGYYAIISILQVRKDEVGKLQCVNSTNFELTSFGHVEMGSGMKSTKNVIQGDEYTMSCDGYGYPLPSAIEWRKDSVLISTNTRVRYRDNTTQTNSTLEFLAPDAVQFEDDGAYTCFATNAFGSSNNQTMTMRVKDRWAALWPFLGIVAEVIVLCTAILLYEKRQQSKMAEEEDEKDAEKEKEALTASENEPAAPNSDDVRQRTSARP
jgi:hypothetical protein